MQSTAIIIFVGGDADADVTLLWLLPLSLSMLLLLFLPQSSASKSLHCFIVGWTFKFAELELRHQTWITDQRLYYY